MPLPPKQLAANRANAAQSTGPRSPEGKARSAQNSRKHGFTASTFAVVRLEDIDEVAASATTSSPSTSPSTPRSSSPSSASPSPSRPSSAPPASKPASSPPASMRPSPAVASPWSGSARNSATAIWKSPRSRPATTSWPKASIASSTTPIVGPLFLRYQAQTERLGVPSGPRAIEEFERLKALRHELPNEPILEAQPEPNETTCIPGPTKPLHPRKSPPPSRRLPAPPSQPTLEPAPVPAGAFRVHRNTAGHREAGTPAPPMPHRRYPTLDGCNPAARGI